MNDLELAFALQDAQRALDDAKLALILKDRGKALESAHKAYVALNPIPLTNNDANICPCHCECGENCDHETCPCKECTEYRSGPRWAG
jgi:hypothetical protein